MSLSIVLLYHRLPTSEALRTSWLNLIYEGILVKNVGKVSYIYTDHFTGDKMTAHASQ